MSCRLCASSDLIDVLDLGATPPCERFLTSEELDEPEITYPLHLRICPECLLLQIPALIRPDETFTDYAYYASYSTSWVEHAGEFVTSAIGRAGLTADSLVVEVASNDGYLLDHVVAAGIPCLGIEPSVNVGDAARAKNVPTMTAFLDQDVAREVRAEHGPADLLVANNVYAHVPDLLGFTKALSALLGDHGLLSIEVHHAANLVRDCQFDTIYHEHFQYYTLLSAMRALSTAGLTTVDAELLPTHGGSLRIWAKHAAHAGPNTPAVSAILDRERSAGLHRVDGYLVMADRAARIRQDLLRYLLRCKESGLSVAGYGAPGKGNTLLNFCGIRTDLLPYTVDRNPYKHGRFTPGVRIPVLPIEEIESRRPDRVLVLPWNLRAELTRQLAPIARWGGKLVYPLPELVELDPRDGALAVSREAAEPMAEPARAGAAR